MLGGVRTREKSGGWGRRLTAHEPEVEREDSVILGEDIWRDDDVQWARWFVVQV